MKQLFILLIMVFGIFIGSAQENGYYYNLVTKDILYFDGESNELFNVNANAGATLDYLFTIDGIEMYKCDDTSIFMFDGYIIFPVSNNDIIFMRYLGKYPSQFVDRCPFINDNIRAKILSVENKVNNKN